MKKREVKNRIHYKICTTPDKPIIYVLHGSQGDLMIDTGRKMNCRSIDRWLRSSGFDIKWIFLTHAHFDHVYNARFFKEKYGAKVLIHEKDKPLFLKEEIPEYYPTSEDSKLTTQMANRLIRTVQYPDCAIDIEVRDDDTQLLRELGFDADIVMLPGHTAGSMGIKQEKVLYCGDACAAKRGDYYTSLLGSDIEAVLRTEKKLFEMNPLIIAPGHGNIIINERAFEHKSNAN